jgi:hypothetical protein
LDNVGIAACLGRVSSIKALPLTLISGTSGIFGMSGIDGKFGSD